MNQLTNNEKSEFDKIKEGIIEVLGKNWAGVSTRKGSLFDLITIGFYPKPTYSQLGTFKGDVSNFNKGDRVKITLKTRDEGSWLDRYTPFGTNISKIEKIG